MCTVVTGSEQDAEPDVPDNVQPGDVGRAHVSRLLRRHRGQRRWADHQGALAAAGVLRQRRHQGSGRKVSNTSHVLVFNVILNTYV